VHFSAAPLLQQPALMLLEKMAGEICHRAGSSRGEAADDIKRLREDVTAA